MKINLRISEIITELAHTTIRVARPRPIADTADVVYQRASDASCMGLRMCMTLIPIVILIIGLIVFKAKYKLTDEKLDEITAELDARHAAEGNKSAEA